MKGSSIKKKDYLAGYLFIAPPIIGFMLFSLIPIVFSLVLSFSEYDFFTGEINLIGFEGYARAIEDELFFKSLGNICIALGGVLLQIAVMLGVALLLTAKVKGVTFFRALFFIPSLCSSVAVTLVWKWVYNYDFGILNGLLTSLGLDKVGWLIDTKVAMISMIIQGIWMGIGGGMVMYIAGLKNAPRQYYEAAEIDGANAFQRFFHITLPCVSPTTFYILVTTIIGTVSDFARYKLMNNGGPDYSTLTPVLYIYQTAFTSQYGYDYTYATAMSWLTGLFIIVLVAATFISSKRWVHYSV
ncbi:MAG: sugar ABC transporter permease [Clostridia bacterium]|nr:sugar ABC transporter permease [Clostridia bacterium]